MKLSKIRTMLRQGDTIAGRWPMLVPRGRARVVGMLLGILVFVAASTQIVVAWATALPSNAVLRVGDTVVTEDDFKERVDVLEALYGVKPPNQGPQRDEFNRDAAKSFAVSLIIDQAAKDNHVVIGNKKAHNALNKIIQVQLPGGRQDFVEFLGSQGIAEGDVVDEVKRQLATSRLFEKITADVKPVTDQEVRAEYQNRKKELVAPEKRHLRNIVVDSEKQALMVLKQARQGVDFSKLAAQYSLDRSTKNKGGDLGTLSAEQLDKGFADVAFKAKNSEYFGPVKNRHGWNVGQVVGVTPAKQLSFNQVGEQLRADMYNRRKLTMWRSWLSNQIKAADVEYADDYRPANPDAPPADTAPR